jgi:hypothetical protein
VRTCAMLAATARFATSSATTCRPSNELSAAPLGGQFHARQPATLQCCSKCRSSARPGLSERLLCACNGSEWQTYPRAVFQRDNKRILVPCKGWMARRARLEMCVVRAALARRCFVFSAIISRDAAIHTARAVYSVPPSHSVRCTCHTLGHLGL